jgi:hypothetical protein
MLTEANLKSLIADNLADVKLFGIQLYLTELIEREKYDSVTPQYRMQSDLVDITNLDDLIAAIPTADMKATANASYFGAYGISTLPFVVEFPNIKVSVAAKYISDAKLAIQHGTGNYKLCFVMGYFNDGDPALPLKIINVLLT